VGRRRVPQLRAVEATANGPRSTETGFKALSPPQPAKVSGRRFRQRRLGVIGGPEVAAQDYHPSHFRCSAHSCGSPRLFSRSFCRVRPGG